MQTPDTGRRYGEVFDRGYQHYDGQRLGRRHAIAALVLYSMKRAVGIKKGIGSKVIPILLYIGVAIPVVVSIGVRAFVPNADLLGYPNLFGIVFVIEGIFIATIAPEMLCGDRRENVLPLYFSRAITRADYLLAKLLATGLLALTISLVPALIMWLGLQLLATRPLLAMRDNSGDLGDVLVAGTMYALFLGAIGLLISSLTGRKSIAVGIIILGFGISEGLAATLTAVLDDDQPLRRFVLFISPSTTSAALIGRLFNERIVDSDVGLGWILAVMLGIVLLCWGVMYWRYVPND